MQALDLEMELCANHTCIQAGGIHRLCTTAAITAETSGTRENLQYLRVRLVCHDAGSNRQTKLTIARGPTVRYFASGVSSNIDSIVPASFGS